MSGQSECTLPGVTAIACCIRLSNVRLCLWLAVIMLIWTGIAKDQATCRDYIKSDDVLVHAVIIFSREVDVPNVYLCISLSSISNDVTPRGCM